MNSEKLTELDTNLTDRIRLAIMVNLYAKRTSTEFTTLLNKLKTTEGNLSCHIRRLEDADYIKVNKKFVKRRPQTTYTCTSKGRSKLNSYLATLSDVRQELLKN